MARRLLFLAFYTALGVSRPSLAAEITDEFNDGALDLCVWDPVQFDYPRLVRFQEMESRRILINLIDENRENENFPNRHPCPKSADALLSSEILEFTEPISAERLGPSLIDPSTRQFWDERKCVEAETRDGKEVVQRNELRFRQTQSHRHAIDDPHWYQIVIKADGDIPNCGSTRWVTAQWKYDDTQWPDISPFLAQRFDNGILHITVQSGDCRCMVAKASGDPDLLAMRANTVREVTPPNVRDLKVIKPLKCLWTGGGGKEGEACDPEGPFRVMALTSPHRRNCRIQKADGWR